jgi:hypothetical protein
MKKDASGNRGSTEDKGEYLSLGRFLGYFLKLGTIGFGGPHERAKCYLFEVSGWHFCLL